jgi:hypothetical protein
LRLPEWLTHIFVGVATLASRFALFLRSDANSDGRVDCSDPIDMLNWLFGTAPNPACIAALNTNGDEAVDIADPIYLINFLFVGGPAPAEPFPACGLSTSEADERLGCTDPPECR